MLAQLLFNLLLLQSPSASDPQLKPLVARWYEQLNDRDADVRAEATEHLMGLQASELGLFKDVIRASTRHTLAQECGVRDVVAQVQLASIDYEPDPGGSGFLGVNMLPIGDFNRPDELLGVAVFFARLPGFVANRWLRDGDIVLALREWKQPLSSSTDFIDVLQKQFHAGQTVHLEIARNGRRKTITLQLNMRPANPAAARLTLEDTQEIDDFWYANFAPLFESTGGDSATSH